MFGSLAAAVRARKRGKRAAAAGIANDDAPAAKTPALHVATPRIVVIGSGPVGHRVAGDLARAGLPVVQFNAERWQPYNRIKLTPLLSGEVQMGQVYQPSAIRDVPSYQRYDGLRIAAVDPTARTVTDDMGRSWPYDKLVMATGARPHIPGLSGINLDGVYAFRDFDDAERLVARSIQSRHAAVIGGGLLGLEVARGMAQRGVRTVVLEHENRLLSRQLDKAAGDLVAKCIEAMGIEVRVSAAVRAVEGQHRVERLRLPEDETVVCDTVIICTGVRANMEMARAAGLAVGRGVTVDEFLRTSDPDIYAVGECAEYAGNCYGLVGPGLEQAAVCAGHILGKPSKSYRGSVPATRLKVVGIDVFSMGYAPEAEEDPGQENVVWSDPANDCYRRLVLRGGRVVAAIAVGPWPEISRVQQAVTAKARLNPWQLRRFRKTGLLYKDEGRVPVQVWEPAATVCNCTGVTRGMLGDAIAGGCSTVDQLRAATCASTVCGTCQPLLQELLGARVTHEAVGGAKPLLMLSAIAALIALVTAVVPAWPYSDSVQAGLRLDLLWIDPLIKQITGFTLVGLMAAAAMLGLRKRIKLFRKLGGYNGWRVVHGVLGAALLTVLFAHTGFNLGQGLNFWLMAAFLGLSVLGAGAGIVTAVEHKLLDGPMKEARAAPRTVPVWAHILFLWPVPVLLSAHVLTVYFY